MISSTHSKLQHKICLVANWCTAGLRSFQAFTSDKAPLFRSCLILFVSSTNYIQKVRRQCCLLLPGLSGFGVVGVVVLNMSAHPQTAGRSTKATRTPIIANVLTGAMLNMGFVVVHFHFHIANPRDHKSLTAFLLTIQESMSCSLPFSVFVWVHIFYFVVTFCGLVLDLPPLWQMRQTSVKAPRCLWNRTIDFFPALYSMFGHETHFSVFIYKDNIIKWIDVLWDVAQKPINKPSKAKLNSFLHTHWVIVSE